MIEKDLCLSCEEALRVLVGKKILDVGFRSQEDDCWIVDFETDDGKFVMTFCKDWDFPVFETRRHK